MQVPTCTRIQQKNRSNKTCSTQLYSSITRLKFSCNSFTHILSLPISHSPPPPPPPHSLFLGFLYFRLVWRATFNFCLGKCLFLPKVSCLIHLVKKDLGNLIMALAHKEKRRLFFQQILFKPFLKLEMFTLWKRYRQKEIPREGERDRGKQIVIQVH